MPSATFLKVFSISCWVFREVMVAAFTCGRLDAELLTRERKGLDGGKRVRKLLADLE